MRLTTAIRRNLKQREHMENLVHDLEKDLKETKRLILKYNRTLKVVNDQLKDWDHFIKTNPL